MKVELEKLRLALTGIDERICIGIPETKNSFRHKHDVTNDFIKAVIEWGGGFRRTINCSDGKKYEVAVSEKKSAVRQIYSRTEIIKMLENAVRDRIGENVSVDKWSKKNLK